MNKIIFLALLFLLGQTSIAETIPTYTKPKVEKPKGNEAESNKAKTIVKKTQPTPTVLIEPEMVFVEGGTFNMGGNDSDNEKPIHKVSVSSFKMSKYEVTQAQWESIMKTNPSYFNDCNTCPVDYVSYTDAQDFIRKLNHITGKKYRSPPEVEFEYTAKGGNLKINYLYSCSSNISKVAWTDENSEQQTHPIGEKLTNELGIYDMSGNALEWCKDWYVDTYYSKSPINNTKGPLSGTEKNLRGGCFVRDSEWCTNTFRTSFMTYEKVSFVGFRLISTE